MCDVGTFSAVDDGVVFTAVRLSVVVLDAFP